MPKTVDPVRAEQDARTRWSNLDAPPPPAVDADGRKIELSPSDRLRGIERRARVIAASDSLADAVLAHLAAAGVTAETDQVRVDPAAGDDLQVMAIRVGDRVVPMRPAATVLRIYPAQDGIVLDGPPQGEAELEPGPDGWVAARQIADAVRAHCS
jgi:hypothetical protein